MSPSPSCAVRLAVSQCGNSIDNDGDALVDCGDADCGDSFDCVVECPVYGMPLFESVCSDCIDNDCDGSTDCGDPDCDGLGCG